MNVTKSERINLRASTREESLLRRAAEAEDVPMSAFILGTAVEQAERVLADRRWFTADSKQFEEFVRLLDEPVQTDRLAELFSRPTPFGRPFSLED